MMTVLQKSISFLFVPFVTTFLTPKEFGFVNHLTAISSAFVLFLLFALDEATSRLYFENRANKKELSQVISTNVCISAAISIVFILLVFLYVFFARPDTLLGFELKYFGIIFCISLSTPIYYIQLKVFRIKSQAFLFSLFSVLNILIQIGCFLVFVVWFKYGALGYLYSITIATITVSILSVISLFYGLSFSPSIVMAKKSISFCLKVFPHTVSSWGLYSLTIIVIGNFLNDASVGLFSVINYLSIVMAVITNAVLYSFQPWLYSKLESEEKDIALSVISFLSYFFAVVSSVVSCFSDYFIEFVFSSQYHESLYIAPVVVITNVVLFLGSLHTYILYYSKVCTSKVAYATIIGTLVNALLVFTLIKPFGLLGAAFSLLIAHLCISLIKQYYSLKYLKVKMTFDFKVYLLCIFNAFVVSGFVYYESPLILRIVFAFCEVFLFVIFFRVPIALFLDRFHLKSFLKC